jgi:hypothetical protein
MVRRVAAAAAGYTGSDLKELCKAAVACSFRAVLAPAAGGAPPPPPPGGDAEMPPLQWADFQDALTRVRPSG